MGHGHGIEDKDKGYKKVQDDLEGKNFRPVMYVGIPASVGAQPKKINETDVSPHQSLVDVATVHEFGTQRVPQRSFLRAWFDANEKALKARVTKMMQQVAKGELDYETLLNQLGAYSVGQIVKRINARIPPELSPVTIAARNPPAPRKKNKNGTPPKAKGANRSATPLVNTAQLRDSITWVIREEASEES